MKNFKILVVSALILILFSTVTYAATLLSDDFESYSSFPSGSWIKASEDGSWSIVTDGSKVAKQTSTSSETYLMVNGDSSWSNYTYSARVKPGSSGNRHGLVARYQNNSNYYFFIFKDGSKLYLYRRVNGSESSVKYTSFTYNSSTYYNLKIELNGSRIKCYVNDNLKLDATDSSLSSGKIGFYTYGTASFDDVSVTDSAAATSTPTATPTPTPTPTSGGSYSKLGLSVIAASPDDGNKPANVLDGNLSTRFASNGDGAYIILGTNSVATLSSVKIAWNNGSSRVAYFEIFTSTDNQTYTKAYPASDYASSSGATTQLEEYDFSDRPARYIKVVGHENSYNTWFSPTEIEAWGIAGAPLPTPTTPSATATPTPTPTPTATPTPTSGGSGTIYNVSSSSQWSNAVSSVQPGDTIRVTANISSGISIKNKTASQSNPIYIVAVNPQQTT